MQLGVYIISFYFPIYLFVKKGCRLNCGARRRPQSVRDNSASVYLDNPDTFTTDEGHTATL